MNLSDMIDLVRQDLHDTDEDNYRWTDAELTRHINRALAELSESLPVPAKATVATTADSRELDISGLTGRVMVAAVEYPVDFTPPEYQQFTLWGDTLTLTSGPEPDGGNCRVYYGTLHTIDAQGSTLPDKYVNIAADGAGGYAAVEMALYTVNRVNTGGLNTPRDMLDWGSQKLKAFRQEVRRLGRRSRVRFSRLSEEGA